MYKKIVYTHFIFFTFHITIIIHSNVLCDIHVRRMHKGMFSHMFVDNKGIKYEG